MTTPSRNRDQRRRSRFVHLGDRLLAIALVRSGEASVESVAEQHGVDQADVLEWLEAHAGERFTSFDELRPFSSPEVRGLVQRARHLAELLAKADREIRDLHQEYVLARAASARRDSSTKKFE